MEFKYAVSPAICPEAIAGMTGSAGARRTRGHGVCSDRRQRCGGRHGDARSHSGDDGDGLHTVYLSDSVTIRPV